ncbi:MULTISPECIES: DNA polymerase I [Butyricimonas]|uniref:DNA polymerase I n=1 Tax=Butyricimonas TaxID=574697 RepID=UPI0007FB4F74|nr:MULTISPECIES: DNA polymerase I [Butyricimonas]
MTNEEKKLYLLDAYALIYRSYYAFINNPRITTTGINTSATFGFFNFLLEIIELEKPSHLAVVFDPEGPTFRHVMFPQYKAQRPPMPEDLKKSIPYIKKIIKGLGITAITVDGFEADDVVGTLAKRGEKEGFQVYMITPDKDYAQLVSDKVFMYKPGRAGNKSEVWGIPEVLDHFGIERVEQVIDILGLMGDTADNVPGCAGVGPKSAAALIYKYGSIEGIYQHIEDLKGKQKERLLCCQNTVFLSKELVTINTEVPTDVNVVDLSLGEIKDDVLKPLFDELELFSLAKRVFAIEHDEQVVDTIHPEEVNYQELTTEGERQELLESLKKTPEYVLNAIFGDGTIYNSYPDYLCFSVASNSACYFRLPAAKGEAEQIIRLFAPVFEDEKKVLISNDVKDDMIWLRRAGIEIKNRIFDIKIAHYVLQPDSSHELERVALELLNYRLIKGDNTENPQLSLFPEEGGKKDKDYAERTDILFRLKGRLESALMDVGLYKLFEELEMPLVAVLADMEYEGVSIDKEALKALSEELKGKIAEEEKIIYEIAGKEFNISSPKQLGEILFDQMNIDPGNKKTKTGQYSTSEQVLSKLEEAHPIVGHILNYRGLKKLLTTYAEALPTYIDSGTGKIHTHFNQAEAATGRLSSLNPNLQNIPIRTEEGRNIRKAFITGDPDYGFFSADYSQVELRLMAHLSGAPGLIDAFLNGEDIHAETASKIYHVPLDEVTPEMRRRAKTANFGIIYGISAWGLAERLKISRKEGKELIDGYFNLYPGVKRYMEESVEKARKQGYVETIMGRRRYLRDINSRNAVVRGVAERNAVNAPIQGSAADIIKKAMICIHQKIKERGLRSKMILQVHDELNFKCHHDEIEELKQLVEDCMEHVVSLAVPLTVGTGYGKNWYEAH